MPDSCSSEKGPERRKTGLKRTTPITPTRIVLFQSMLHVTLDLEEEPWNALPPTDVSLGMEKIVFVDRRDPGMHQVRRQDQFRLHQ